MDIGMLLKNINERLETQLNAYLHTLGLTIAQLRVLHYVYGQPGRETTQKKLEVYLNVAHPTISGIVRRLEEKGLVATKITMDERLAKHVRITEKGTDLYKETGRSRTKHEKLLTENFTTRERATLVTLLEKVQQNIQDHGG